MHIHILNALNSQQLRTNKDTNGGYGTANEYGSGLTATLLKVYKKISMSYPEILPAYVHSILKKKGHTISYATNCCNSRADITLIPTSIVHFSEELKWADTLKRQYPHMKIGFIGGMSSANPELYRDKGDFTVTGESENAFMKMEMNTFSGVIEGGLTANLDDIPFPEWKHIKLKKKKYGLIGNKTGSFLPILSSRGCPMRCSYYCTYPVTQGKSFRARSPENVIEEIKYLQKAYDCSTVMFRDPIFSLDMKRILKICELILKQNIHIQWICETHTKYLEPDLVRIMSRAGCTAVKVGVESFSADIMKKSHRAIHEQDEQEKIIQCCEDNNIKVLAFYIIGYADDTRDSILQTIKYAVKLNTFGAQFTVATPYPGTPWYRDLSEKNMLRLDNQFEHYNQYHLVFDHPNLSFTDIEDLKSLAYSSYYLRPSFLVKNLLMS